MYNYSSGLALQSDIGEIIEINLLKRTYDLEFIVRLITQVRIYLSRGSSTLI